MTLPKISVQQLAEAIQAPEELAVLDPRDHNAYHAGHIFWAASLRPENAESEAHKLVPRRSARIVVTDDGNGEGRELYGVLKQNGWTDIGLLDGGTQAWIEKGYEVYSGVNVPSKLFGELVERHYQTPHVQAQQLSEWISQGRELLILDSRTQREFNRMNIPGGRSCPGGELVYRIFDLLKENTTVVVNCAGRTRSILGTASLIRAGIPNPVVALENGTMGWELAGLQLENGSTTVVGPPSKSAQQKAAAASQQITDRFGVTRVTESTLQSWQSDTLRTLYLFDVRSPSEYERGHRRHFRNAPGGQLIQATDEYVATRGARIVLTDDDLTRATVTASWLLEMGWEAYVYEAGLNEDPLEVGADEPPTHSPQVVLPYDPGDVHVAYQAMQDYLDWEVALVEQYDRDELVNFTDDSWA
ncbi:MAG: rhodanese-like domain-containing protein [Actinomycetota bacterium]|nr:rhodanese-like domain-containing protein [Actinomycetota bacterium]